jgi:hypothetical protein
MPLNKQTRQPKQKQNKNITRTFMKAKWGNAQILNQCNRLLVAQGASLSVSMKPENAGRK